MQKIPLVPLWIHIIGQLVQVQEQANKICREVRGSTDETKAFIAGARQHSYNYLTDPRSNFISEFADGDHPMNNGKFGSTP